MYHYGSWPQEGNQDSDQNTRWLGQQHSSARKGDCINSDNLTLILGTDVEEEDMIPASCPLNSTHTGIPPYMHTRYVNECKTQAPCMRWYVIPGSPGICLILNVMEMPLKAAED